MKNTKTKASIKTQAVKTGKSDRTAIRKEVPYDRYFENAAPMKISIDLIDYSPLNRRKFFNQAALEELADSIKLHGIIQDIGVRPKEGGRYELIYGHRRLKAARMAGCTVLKAKLASVPEEVVKEIMLSENAQREDQHPMDEAYSIGLMLEDRKTQDEIALRLGKSKSFVFVRAKLLALIEPIQELFFYDKINIQEAVEIATLSEESQKDLFDKHCRGWKDREDFQLRSIRYILKHYRYDLNSAPFDTADKTLAEKAGACTNCPFNTATLTTLFPEEAEEAICTNKNCFEQKCATHFSSELIKAAAEIQPQVLILPSNINDTLKTALDSMEAIKDLPRWDQHNSSIIHPPVAPTKEDYNMEDKVTDSFDEDGYQLALQEHEQNKQEFALMLAEGTVLKGMLITNTQISGEYFSKDVNPHKCGKPKITAKQVQDAIKAGAETPELLRDEMERIITRENRAKELDAEHIKEETHKQFERHVSTFSNTREFTAADTIAARLLIYHSLNYSNKNQMEATLGLGKNFTDTQLWEALKNLNDLQYAYLIRMAVAGKSDAKIPTAVTGICLMELAESAGVDVTKIKHAQNAIATSRAETVDRKVESLEARIAELQEKVA